MLETIFTTLEASMNRKLLPVALVAFVTAYIVARLFLSPEPSPQQPCTSSAWVLSEGHVHCHEDATLTVQGNVALCTCHVEQPKSVP